jgi:hypothetical protein
MLQSGSVRDFPQRSSLLNVPVEKGNHGAEAYDGDAGPDDALSGQPKRFSFHIETNEKPTSTTLRNTISK